MKRALALIPFVLIIALMFLSILLPIGFVLLRLPSETARVTAAAFIGIITATLAPLFLKAYERRQEIENDIREHKAIAYEGYIKGLYLTLNYEQVNEEMKLKIMNSFINDYGPKMICWASKDAINDFSLLRSIILCPPKGRNINEVVPNQIEVCLKTVRKDLGHNDEGLESHSLSLLFSKLFSLEKGKQERK